MSTATKARPKKPRAKRVTSGWDVIAWIETHCIFTQARWLGHPFRLQPWQKRVILELFELDPKTRLRRFRWAYISVPKKNGKTELLAALALWFLIGSGEPSPLIACAAGSDDQADLIFGAARVMAEGSPTLRRICKVFEAEIIVPSIPGARLVRVAASARKHGSNLDGKNIFVVIVDELHVWEGERGDVIWGTLTRGTGAREQPMVIQITTAGFDRESICYRQYEIAKKVLEDPTSNPSYYAFVVEAADGADYTSPAVWAAVNPSYGVTVQEPFFVDQLRNQPENEFRRFYLNQWTRSAESWLPPGAWEAGRNTGVEIPTDAVQSGGVDVALKHDSTAVVRAWRRPELVDGKARFVVKAKIWRPVDGAMDVAEPMAHIRSIRNWRTVSYDPRFFDLPAGMLADEGIPMVETPQSPERMVPACGLAYELIANGQVEWDGDPEFEDHVLSAVQRPGERGWTLSKGKSKRKIDACIAMVLALWEANQPEAPVLVPKFTGWSDLRTMAAELGTAVEDAVNGIEAGRRVECTAETWPEVREALVDFATYAASVGKHEAAQLARTEVARLDTEFREEG